MTRPGLYALWLGSMAIAFGLGYVYAPTTKWDGAPEANLIRCPHDSPTKWCYPPIPAEDAAPTIHTVYRDGITNSAPSRMSPHAAKAWDICQLDRNERKAYVACMAFDDETRPKNPMDAREGSFCRILPGKEHDLDMCVDGRNFSAKITGAHRI